MLESRELLELAERGWIPAPEEEESTFQERILQGEKTLSRFPPAEEEGELLEAAARLTLPLFGFRRERLSLLYSNRKLSLFEGAAAWIFQEKEGLPKEAFLQLRTSLRGKKRLYGYYPVEELVAHELIHVARMGFEEPLFEEFLAYECSSSPFRRRFGPLFRRPREVNLFLLTLVLPLFGLFMPLLWLLPVGTLLALLIRLLFHRGAFERKKREIARHLPKERRGLFLLAQTDEEILREGIAPPIGDLPRERLLRALLSLPSP